MVPAAFDYRAPGSLGELLELLGQHGDEAKVMAGGQSLIPLLKLRLAAPTVLLDLRHLSSLGGVSRESGRLRIGALTRHVDIERDGSLAQLCPLLAEAAPQISDPLVRNRGTVGGSLCHADPAGDWGSVMLALNAELVAVSPAGERTIPAREFFRGPFTTGLRPDEVLTEVRVPLRERSGGAYLKLERKVGDFATVGVAVQVELEDGRISQAGIGLTSVGATNLKASEAERALAGREPTVDVIAQAATLAAQASEPHDDVRGSADYKRDVVRVFVQRGLRRALERAGGSK
ncbi:MAG: xanthine dehydrogenase family protein subunit M [Candidatus Dormibacteraeota bacterium]|nr:xanthine dehydrogenase family protein subunit M [Candidatus Dormibacteraeota bacterium]